MFPSSSASTSRPRASARLDEPGAQLGLRRRRTAAGSSHRSRTTARSGRGRATSAQTTRSAPWSSGTSYAGAGWSAGTPTGRSTRPSSTGCSSTRSAPRARGSARAGRSCGSTRPTTSPGSGGHQPRAAGADSAWLDGMRTAPVVIVPLSNRDAYLDRYAEPDKGWTDRDEARWPVPYWHIDTGMAALLILQTAVDEGLGACFFGIPPDRMDAFRDGVRRARGLHAHRRDHRRPPRRRRRRGRLRGPAPSTRTSTRSSTTAGGADRTDTPSVHRAPASGSTATRRPRSRIRDALASCHDGPGGGEAAGTRPDPHRVRTSTRHASTPTSSTRSSPSSSGSSRCSTSASSSPASTPTASSSAGRVATPAGRSC